MAPYSILVARLSVHPKIFDFVTKVEKWGHPCPVDTFLAAYNSIMSYMYNSGVVENLVYDAVLICTGHHADVHKPTFPGLDRYVISSLRNFSTCKVAIKSSWSFSLP